MPYTKLGHEPNISPYATMRFYNCHRTVVLLALLAELGCRRGAQFYLDRGNRLFAEGKFEEAGINYRKCVSSSPQMAEAHYRLALDEVKRGHRSEAYNE